MITVLIDLAARECSVYEDGRLLSSYCMDGIDIVFEDEHTCHRYYTTVAHKGESNEQ